MRFRLLLILALALTLISCGSEKEPTVVVQAVPVTTISSTALIQTIPATTVNSTSQTSPAQTMPKDWQYRWLKGIPCQLPCWEKITPNSTTATEAFKLLQQNLLIDQRTLSLNPVRTGESYSSLSWYWLESKRDPAIKSGDGGDAFYSAGSQLIYLIRLRMPKLKLSEVIQAYGEPGYIAATDETVPEGYPLVYVVRFVYLSQGFLVKVFLDKSTELSPLMEVEEPEIFAPGLSGFKAIGYAQQILVNWQGYKSFDFYCRESDGVRAGICSRLKSRP